MPFFPSLSLSLYYTYSDAIRISARFANPLIAVVIAANVPSLRSWRKVDLSIGTQTATDIRHRYTYTHV